MKIYKYFILSLIVLSVLFSCVKPSENTERKNILIFLKDTLDTFNKLKNDDKKRNDYAKNLMDGIKEILVLNKNTTFTVTSREAKPGNDVLAYTLNKNQFIVKKPIYITFEKNNLIFSLDNKIWYSSKNDIYKNIESMKQDINYETKVDNNNFYLDYDMTFKIGKTPLIVKSPDGKKVFTLKKDMIIASPDEKNINIDLKKAVLYIPNNTIIDGKMDVIGNIIESKNDGEKITLKMLTDLYIFIKNKMFSLSFDNQNWNINIFYFNIDPKLEIKAVEDNKISYDIKIKANYQDSEVSFSILSLLLNSIK
jgi:hypothetical protein